MIDYLIGVGDALSQLANKVIFNGNPNESLSGRAHRENRPSEKWIDWLLFWDYRHCRASHENDVKYAQWLLKNISTMRL